MVELEELGIRHSTPKPAPPSVTSAVLDVDHNCLPCRVRCETQHSNGLRNKCDLISPQTNIEQSRRGLWRRCRVKERLNCPMLSCSGCGKRFRMYYLACLTLLSTCSLTCCIRSTKARKLYIQMLSQPSQRSHHSNRELMSIPTTTGNPHYSYA